MNSTRNKDLEITKLRDLIQSKDTEISELRQEKEKLNSRIKTTSEEFHRKCDSYANHISQLEHQLASSVDMQKNS